MQPSVIALVGILQRHGLSVELLQLMVDHCERKCTGGLVLATSQGQIIKYELRTCGTVTVVEEISLTKVSG